jgi:thiol:disulfide interchange protein
MKKHSMIQNLIVCFLLIGTVVWSVCGADKPAKPARAPIYDTKADGAKQVTDALAAAKREHKHVLLQFGANWCGWCHKLHNLFQSDKEIAAVLKTNYVVALIDVDTVDGKKHNADINTRYGNPCRFGLPAIVVLDADGKQLTTQDTGKLEAGNQHDPAKVLAFLKQWSPKKPD